MSNSSINFSKGLREDSQIPSSWPLKMLKVLKTQELLRNQLLLILYKNKYKTRRWRLRAKKPRPLQQEQSKFRRDAETSLLRERRSISSNSGPSTFWDQPGSSIFQQERLVAISTLRMSESKSLTKLHNNSFLGRSRSKTERLRSWVIAKRFSTKWINH